MPIPDRKCNGGPKGPWCGKPATVVCSRDEPMPARMVDVAASLGQKFGPLQWFACAEHTEGAQTEPIAEWFARNVPSDVRKPYEPPAIGHAVPCKLPFGTTEPIAPHATATVKELCAVSFQPIGLHFSPRLERKLAVSSIRIGLHEQLVSPGRPIPAQILNVTNSPHAFDLFRLDVCRAGMEISLELHNLSSSPLSFVASDDELVMRGVHG